MMARVELLATHHQRQGFDCGEPALNLFLQNQAGQLARRGFAKTYVVVADNGTAVAGFVCVSAAQVEAVQLPANLKLPRYPVPALRIGRLAVDVHYQRQGIGQLLMGFALQLALDFSNQIGLYAVLIDAKDARAKGFFETLGFKSTLDNPLSLYLPLSTLHQLRQPPAGAPH